jgi:acetylglutamate kinase
MKAAKVRVVKIGGRVQNDPALCAALVAAERAAPGGMVVVHGGGDEVSSMQRRLGLEPRFVGGRRVTTDAELEIVRMVLSATANKRLVMQCRSAGLRAVGVSGEDGGLLTAHVAYGAPLGRVGARVQADAALLHDLMAAGWFPIVSPVARDGDDPAGSGLNVNGDDAAAAIAAAMCADELVFVADVAGVLVDGRVVPSLSQDEASTLVDRGIADGGMAAKLGAARSALESGVMRVRIADLAALTDANRGTLLVASPFPPGSLPTSPLSPTVAPWPQ